jgi:hypothetical protein
LPSRRSDVDAQASPLQLAADLYQVRLCILLVMVRLPQVQVVRAVGGADQDQTGHGRRRQFSSMSQGTFGERRAIKGHQNASQHGSHGFSVNANLSLGVGPRTGRSSVLGLSQRHQSVIDVWASSGACSAR